MKEILKQVKQYKKDSFLTPFYSALEVVMEVLLPFIMAKIIDNGIEKGDMSKVYLYGGLMILAAMLSLFAGVMAGKYAASASSGLACNLREAIYRKIQTFSFSNIDKYSTAGLVTRMTTDVTNVQNAYQMCIRIAVRAPLMLITSMVMSFLINAEMSLTFLIALVFLAAVLGFIMLRAMKLFDKAFRKYDDLNASIQENISAVRVVKAYVREDYEKEKFSKASGNLYKLFTKAEGILAYNNPAMMLVSYGAVILISWMGAHLIVGGSLTTGELTSLFTYIFNAFMSLMMLSFIFVMISMSTASIKRISEVLTEVPDLRDPENPVTEMADGSIDFNNVSFAYRHGEGKDVLKNIDLHIKSGETIGIIGSTGCGKTSFVNLISRLYDVSDGSVCVGGLDVREYDMEYLRDQVSVVLQKNVLFSGTILDNLRWGDENATDEECIDACKSACADEFIQRFPDKYNTYIERGGANVSGGQKQRLCIARALLKKPKVLILDDSTSAVDTATDAKIRSELASKIPGTTKLIIAQRISSVEHADRIIVLDNGEINGIGSHDELIENNEIYNEIYTSQVKGGGDFDNPAANIENTENTDNTNEKEND
ncbi:ABC transporter ATP-binding protein [uncultured Ruminococcus sp.]|uniref:ABC transporter ATP-binding protein n=1 Tax=uncultured Ruminococcus sp. TaxID=165186 RepID=UPI0025F8499F|nr:ABC transporter ATP-binding protein [uncultured Ruminococcus sp.]